ncbi:MAG: hypothetical protein WCF94_01085 [bacterium]
MNLDEIFANEEKVNAFIEDICSDQKKFCDFVYTPVDEAIEQLKTRQNDTSLDEKIKTLIKHVPLIMEGRPKAILFRNVTTPNYETKWFADVVSTLEEHLHPLFLEYTKDMFTNRNECKFALGKLLLYKGNNKKNEPMFESEKIIDINVCNSKPINTINTTANNNQNLVDFHHDIFLDDFAHFKDNIHDFSGWVHENGPTAKEYYKKFFVFFLKHGVLFENYLIRTSELPFIKEVILKAFIEIYKNTGYKPLIATIEPTEIEDGKFWQAYPIKIRDRIIKEVGGQSNC